ncbi:hypothetical protein [Sulfurovum sp.]|uniref:hypothetical protein n=1 Tax=Sulfurovum sp. TaxID=1969726 RepID=UPI003562FECD
MKKIWMMSAAVSTLLCAQEITQESIAQQLENKKVKAAKESGFMPDLSLVVDTSYTDQSFDEDGHADHLEIPGFVHGGGHDHADHGHSSLAGEDGFNFNYAELTIGASVDNYFDLKSVFHITEDDFEVEEAYATTRALPYHLQAKIGRFKSDFGYLNNKHHHNYNFSDMPLIYQSLLGDHGLREDGAQLQYVMPLSVYVMVGIEALEGENEQSFGVDSFSPYNAGEDFNGVDKVSSPGLWVGYVKSSFDMAGGTLLGGLSMAKGDSRIDHLEDEEGAHAFAGDTTLYGVDLVYKKYFAADHVITWQSEYLYREMDGTKYIPNDTQDAWANEISQKKEQAGFYSELVYQYDKNWRTGARYSAITQNDITADGMMQDMPDDMYVASAMLEYNPSEFSRLRLQYNHNSSLYNEEGEKNNKNEVVLQFNYAIGAHGAHAF